MIASLMFLIAALAQLAGAGRMILVPFAAKPGLAPPNVNASDAHRPMARGPVRVPRLQMSLDPNLPVPEAWEPDISERSRIFQKLQNVSQRPQAFPPTKEKTLRVSRVLETWDGQRRTTFPVRQTSVEQTIWQDKAIAQKKMQKIVDNFKAARAIRYTAMALNVVLGIPYSYVISIDEDQYVDPESKEIRRLEAVSLVGTEQAPGLNQYSLRAALGKQFDRRSLVQNLSLATALPPVEPKAKALAIFSREELLDSRKGASAVQKRRFAEQLKMVGADYGIRATRGTFGLGKTRLPTFSIKGLVEDPSLSIESARVLLAKIAKWAETEQRLVVVEAEALHFGDGTDLTAYYMRLGFKKIERDDGSYFLIYSGTFPSSELQASDTDQLMVGVTILGPTL